MSNNQLLHELKVGIVLVWYLVVQFKVLLLDQPLDGCGDVTVLDSWVSVWV